MSKQSVPPVKYNQPIRDYIGRTMQDNKEIVDFVPQSHLRIWYNTQEEGYETHHHNAAEIILCIENFYQVSVGNAVYNMKPDDILFIPPEMLHSISGDKGIRLIFLLRSFRTVHDSIRFTDVIIQVFVERHIRDDIPDTDTGHVRQRPTLLHERDRLLYVMENAVDFLRRLLLHNDKKLITTHAYLQRLLLTVLPHHRVNGRRNCLQCMIPAFMSIVVIHLLQFIHIDKQNCEVFTTFPLPVKQPAGFLLMVVGAFMADRSVVNSLVNGALKMPSILFFVIAVCALAGMVVCAMKFDRRDVRGNWIEQGINIVAQGCVLLGVWFM